MIRVKRGAEVLDAVRPDWHHEIDLDHFDVGSGWNCVLGQLYGGYYAGLLALRIFDGDPVRLGFNGRNHADDGVLTRQWTKLILRRLG
jgi:hypothetical protein